MCYENSYKIVLKNCLLIKYFGRKLIETEKTFFHQNILVAQF